MMMIQFLFFIIFISNVNSYTSCFSEKTTVTDLMRCLSDQFTKRDSMTLSQWKRTLPTSVEKYELQKIVKQLLSSDRNCERIYLGSFIRKEMKITIFRNKFCVLHNTRNDPKTGKFARPWAVIVVPRDKSDRIRSVHHSAPHFDFDTNTGNQASAIFELSESTSLIVSAIGRLATKEKQNTCQSDYYPADGGHNDATMFHVAAVATWEWQMNEGGGCDHSNCAFIQWHGKGSSTCPNDHAFISTGAKKTSTVYYDRTIPSEKLKFAIRHHWKDEYPNLRASSSLDSDCNLIARTNTFGRLVNGVAAGSVCRSYAKKISGHFVHIEQAKDLRMSVHFNNWANAVKDAFCARF